MSGLAEPIRSSGLILAKGFCMGSADVVPGVSGGTMAFILGIYERLLKAIRSFDLQLLGSLGRLELGRALRHIDGGFLVPLILGIFAALMFFTRVVPLPALILSDPEPVYSLFLGLVVASIVVLLRELPSPGGANLIWLGVGALVGWSIFNMVPFATPEAPWFVFLCGALAISAMILPGISGSFILLVLRKYAYIFDGIGRLDLGIIVPFALGAVLGLVLFSRVLLWLLGNYYQRTLETIIGLLLGSLWVLWPFQERSYEIIRGKTRLVGSAPVLPTELDASVAVALGLALFGLSVVFMLHFLANRRQQVV